MTGRPQLWATCEQCGKRFPADISTDNDLEPVHYEEHDDENGRAKRRHPSRQPRVQAADVVHDEGDGKEHHSRPQIRLFQEALPAPWNMLIFL